MTQTIVDQRFVSINLERVRIPTLLDGHAAFQHLLRNIYAAAVGRQNAIIRLRTKGHVTLL
jgi:hypothetical protein